NIYRRLRRESRRMRMLLQIHDELVFEVPPEELELATQLVGEEMTRPLEKALRLEVPLKVDLAIGPNWRDGQWKEFGGGRPGRFRCKGCLGGSIRARSAAATRDPDAGRRALGEGRA